MKNITNSLHKMKEDGASIGVIIVVAIILFGIVIGLECGIVFIAMLLWNSCLVAVIPAIHTIGYWQMWGIYILSNIIFKSFTSSVKTKE